MCEDMFSVFARPKPCKILTILKNSETIWHLSKIAKETGTTYVYVTKLMTKLESFGLVLIESKGKKRVVRLTEKGMEISKLIDELRKRFEQ